MTILRRQILELKSQPTLENLKIMVFTDIIQEHNIRVEDLDLFCRVVAQLEKKVVAISQGEDIKDINLEDGKED